MNSASRTPNPEALAKIERAIVASLAEPGTPRDLFFRAKTDHLGRYLTDPAAFAGWEHFSKTGEFDSMTFEAKHREHWVALSLAQEIGLTRYALGERIKLLREAWSQRTLVRSMEEAREMPTEEALAHLETAKQEIHSTAPAGDLAEEIRKGLEEIEARARGDVPENLLTWGIDWIDRSLGRLNDSELVVIGGRPGQGKSALLAQTALAMRGDGIPVSIFSLEMTGKQIMHRMTAQRSGISIKHLGPIHPDRNSKFREAYKAITSDPGIFWHASSSKTLNQILALAAIDVKGRGAKVVFIDYLQLIEVRGFKSRREAIEETTRSLRKFALDNRVPVIVASQLNRESDKESREPRLSDLRESGGIEQDADRVILIYRPKDDARREGATDELICPKNRDDGINSVRVSFTEHLTRFEELKKWEAAG